MTRLIHGLVLGAGILVAAYSALIGDWQTAAMAGVVVVGVVAYRRGWIRRFGR